MASKPNLNILAWILLECLYIFALTLKPNSMRLRSLFFVVILTLSAYALVCYKMDFRHLGLGERGLSARLPILVSFASSNIMLCEPHTEIRLAGQKQNVSELPFASRLWWALLVWANPRGVGFAHEPGAHLPPRPKHKTRSRFVLAQLQSIFVYLLLLDLVGAINRANPYYTKDAPVVLGIQRLWWLAGFGFGAAIWILMSMQYMVFSIVLVLSGVSSPSDCPAYFGSPFDGYTVRRVWSKFWHQMLRRPCVAHANAAAKALHLVPNSTASFVCKLSVAFLLSGIIHYISEAVVMQSLTEPLGCFLFFLLQIIAILVEEFVMRFSYVVGFSKGHGTWWAKGLGYLWVLLWINFSLPYWTNAGYRAGWTEEIPQFSVLLGLFKGQWFPPNEPTVE